MSKIKNELMNKYREDLSLVWHDERMINHCIKTADVLVELKDGSLICIDKQKIKTDFCFGYGFCGVSTDEDEERANEIADTMENDIDMFITANMADVNRRIDELKNCIDKNNIIFVYTIPHGDAKFIRGYSFDYKIYEVDVMKRYENVDLKILDIDDVKRILAGYEEHAENMMKKINTYLKKYGLKHLNIWTYLRD